MTGMLPEWLLAVVASAYALSLPFAGWLVWEAGRVRRDAGAAPSLAPRS